MEAMKAIGPILIVMLSASGAAQAGEASPGDDLWEPYTARSDKATGTSGNAQEVNSITQIITPWPPYVADRRIPGDGERMVGAIRRYRDPRATGGVAPAPRATAPVAPGGAGTAQSGGTGQTGGSGNPGQGEQ